MNIYVDFGQKLRIKFNKSSCTVRSGMFQRMSLLRNIL